MLVHYLDNPSFVACLHHAGIWKGMHASLFEYEVNSNAIEALISYWNRPIHTILTRMGEMRITLLNIAKIGVTYLGKCI